MQPSRSHPRPPADRFVFWSALAVCAAAILGRLPVLGAYWFAEDWRLLAGATGLLADPVAPARLLGGLVYWRVMVPLFELDPAPYAVTRLLLHGACALATMRLARRSGLADGAALVAGLLIGASPLAFPPLYQAAGVQELLATCCALWAVERWLVGTGGARAVAVGLALLAFVSWENCLALPLLLILLPSGGPDTGRRTSLIVAFLAMAAIAEATLASNLAAGASGVDLPGLDTIGRRLLHDGALLLTWGRTTVPADALAARLAGAVLWLGWGGIAGWAFLRGRRLPAVCLLAALLSILAVVLLRSTPGPGLYVAHVASILALVSLPPGAGRWPRHPAAVLLPALAIGLVGWSLTQTRLQGRDPAGFPADPQVRLGALSYGAIQNIRQLPDEPLRLPEGGLIILQVPPPGTLQRFGPGLADEWIARTDLYEAFGGALAPRVLLGPDATIHWRNNLKRGPIEALVLVDAGPVPLHWGSAIQAMQYLTLTQVAQGRFVEARLHLLRASLESGDNISFLYDPDLMIVEPGAVADNAQSFLDFLDDPTKSQIERRGLGTNFSRLMQAVFGPGPRS